MPEQDLIERLDAAVEAMLRRPDTARVPEDRELQALWRVAADLVELPRASFRARLKSDIERRATMATATAVPAVAPKVSRGGAAPFLTLKDPVAAIAFYERAFGAVERMRLTEPGGGIAHAEIEIGEARFMIGHEYPELGFRSAESLGGSPISIHLYVDDVDALIARAAGAGAKVLRPAADQFHGDRAGSVRDPFGITWLLATRKHEVSTEEMQRRLDAMMAPPPPEWKPKGFRALTPYLIVGDAGATIDFMKQAFGAIEKSRAEGPGGRVLHAEIQIGDSMLELGEGGEAFPARPAALHLYVDDADAVYARAVAAGATTLFPLGDRPYGDREGDVKDPFGNNWYIATHQEGGPIPPGMNSLTLTLHAKGTDKLIGFVKEAFGAEEVDVTRAPDGTVVHAQLKLDDSILELGEARAGVVDEMPAAIHYYVPDVDAAYARALAAGATSAAPPSLKPYGERMAAVNDAWGNQWFLATMVKDPRAGA